MFGCGIVRLIGTEKERCIPMIDDMTECGFLNIDDSMFIEFSMLVPVLPGDDAENE